jgi:DNA-binding beta-propeller fold protein YncE
LTIHLAEDNSLRNSGLAVHELSSVMAVSNKGNHTVSLFGLSTGNKIGMFGTKGSGPGQFNEPWKLCFTPEGTLLVAEYGNSRLQEVTAEGAHVRYFLPRSGVPAGRVVGVAANEDHVVVSQHGENHRILVFDRSAVFMRSFGRRGSYPGNLYGSEGIRLTPDGRSIIIAEYDNSRISVFTMEGRFRTCFGDCSTIGCVLGALWRLNCGRQ